MYRKAMKELRRRALDVRPTVHVGKEGVTDAVAEELKRQVKAVKLVKVKVLVTSGSATQEVAEALAEATGTVLVDVRGGVAIFSDKRTCEQLSARR